MPPPAIPSPTFEDNDDSQPQQNPNPFDRLATNIVNVFTINQSNTQSNMPVEALPTDVAPTTEVAEAADAPFDPVFWQEEGKEDMGGQEIFDITSKYVFNREHHKIYIRIHQVIFDKVLEDGANGVDSGYGLVDEFYLDDDRITNVGIRVRGNTSAGQFKRQFKFKFDIEHAFAWRDGCVQTVYFEKQDDRRFFGLHSFSVRASQNDPSKIREMLSGKVFRECALGTKDHQRPWRTNGGLVYRAAFGTLYVTNGRKVEEGKDDRYPNYRVAHNGYLYDPKGLYVMTEDIDKTFLKTRFERFPNEKVKGYLYQADYGKAYFDKEKYTRTGWKMKLVKGKKPKDEEDYEKGDEKMFDLIHTLTGNPSDIILREDLDMDSMNAYLAGACFCTHWDSLVANRNNDYMFYWKRDVLDDEMNAVLDDCGDPVEEHKWYAITWDLDNTLWDDPSSSSEVRNPYRDWFSNYIYEPAEKDSKKTNLIETVFNSGRKSITDVYDNKLREILKGYYSESEYNREVDELGKRVKDAIEDTRKVVSQAGWNTSWGEKYRPEDYSVIKKHAADRRHKFWAQLD